MISLGVYVGFPGGSDGKGSACRAEDLGSTPGLKDPLGESNGNPLQYFSLKNPRDRGAWWATIHGSQSQTRLSNYHTHTHTHVISNRQLDGHGWSTKECLSWRERLRKVLGIRAVMKPPEMAEIDQNGTDYTDKKKKKKSSSYQTNKQKTQTSTRENQERSRET